MRTIWDQLRKGWGGGVESGATGRRWGSEDKTVATLTDESHDIDSRIHAKKMVRERTRLWAR